MSRYFLPRYASLDAYVPGEQPQDKKYLKLNTNESPFLPSPLVRIAVADAAFKLNLYSDPESHKLCQCLADYLDVTLDCVLPTNGSDEALEFAFAAFCDDIVFPSVTYGFYPVLADVLGIPYTEIPLEEDFTICVDDYIGIDRNIVIANPNAPTGIALPLSDMERIVAGNPDKIVIIDEAYVAFGGESAVPLIKKYGNLIVTQTFSKSWSLAGARLGFAVACPNLIADMKTVKNSLNPYNVNRVTEEAGCAAIREKLYYQSNCKAIMEAREYTAEKLRESGFSVLPSSANFVFAKHEKYGGEELYRKLKEKGVLVRHFSKAGISDFLRITIASKTEMKVFLKTLDEVLGEA